MKDISSKHDNFLADAVKAKDQRLGYLDGLRFGLGFFMAGLITTVILGGLSWAVIVSLHLH
jgi:hypothetical protein